MTITTPKANDTFSIEADPKWPSIVFTTDAGATDAHTWTWKITWKTYSKNGTATTTGNTWDAQSVITNLGGDLSVTATANNQSATVAVKITGKQPTRDQVVRYLGTKANSAGFERILDHESKMKHFTATGEPVKSFDNGYGICQLTSPAPSYEQCWNWQLNIDGGLTLYASKRTSAITYLTQSGRTYTNDQLERETICRWNGGSYHTWDGSKWIRNPDVLCDSQTGNIGWDMTLDDNKGKTETELRTRDKDSYKGGRKAGALWRYYGICYADRLIP